MFDQAKRMTMMDERLLRLGSIETCEPQTPIATDVSDAKPAGDRPAFAVPTLRRPVAVADLAPR